MTVLPCSPDDAWWATERTGYEFAQDARGFRAVDKNGRICGMVLFDRWTPNAAQMHVTLDVPVAARCLIEPSFVLPFLVMRLGLVFGVTPADNEHATALAKRLGFRETHRIKDGWDEGVDLIISEMRRDECRWLPDRRQ